MVSMMNTTTLLAVCLASFALVGVAYAAPGRATSVQDASGPSRPASASRDAIPAPEAILVTSEVVVVGTVSKQRAKSKKAYVCTGWQESQVGGSYKRCEWK